MFYFFIRGTHLVTSAGDGTVKIWDFVNARCATTFSEHTQVIKYVFQIQMVQDYNILDFFFFGNEISNMRHVTNFLFFFFVVVKAVWGCRFHDTGDFVASCSMDHTAKVKLKEYIDKSCPKKKLFLFFNF